MMNVKTALGHFSEDTKGSILPTAAVLLTVIIGIAGAAVDYSRQVNARSKLQDIVDASVLAGAHTPGNNNDKLTVAQNYFNADIANFTQLATRAPSIDLEFTPDGALLGRASADIPLFLSGVLIDGPLQVGVAAEVGINEPESSPCVYVLANQPQAAIFNGGANIVAPSCDINVHSERNPAILFNAGANLDINRLCVAGSNIINNGGTVNNLETNCTKTPDPFAGVFTNPPVPVACTTRGPQDGPFHRIPAGKHCNTIFNGSPTIEFEPGVHIIDGTMIWNSGSTINAPGVTFYFPNTDSQIRPNGNHVINASAPTSGIYEGILMFENTQNPTNNNRKRQYIINGSPDENLEGIIYLPNRDLTYNSGGNITANKTTIVVNRLTVNGSGLNITPFEEPTTGSNQTVFLKR